MAANTVTPRSRRAVLAAALGGLGALAAHALGRPAPAVAADPNDVVKNADNATTALTSVTQGTAVTDAFAGSSPTGTGLRGHSTDDTPSTFPMGSRRTGVIGAVGDTTGMDQTTDEVGVYGFSFVSGNSVGVLGDGSFGSITRGNYGAVGIGDTGVLGFNFTDSPARSIGVQGDVGPGSTGVYGNTGVNVAPAPPTGGIGVYARAETNSQTALQVSGKVKFSRSGRLAVPRGRTSISRSTPGVTTSSIIIAVLQTSEAGTWVRAAVPATGRFTVYFNRALPSSSYVGWFIIN